MQMNVKLFFVQNLHKILKKKTNHGSFRGRLLQWATRKNAERNRQFTTSVCLLVPL
jgi:hypothetical protein